MFPAFPFVMYLIADKWIPMAPVYLPWVDIETARGYTITYIFHFLCDVLAIFGFIGNDLLFGVLILHYLPIGNVFSLRLQQFSNEVSRNRRYGESEEAYQYFCNIIMMHKDMLR